MNFALRLLRSFEGATGTIILVLLAVAALAAPSSFRATRWPLSANR